MSDVIAQRTAENSDDGAPWVWVVVLMVGLFSVLAFLYWHTSKLVVESPLVTPSARASGRASATASARSAAASGSASASSRGSSAPR